MSALKGAGGGITGGMGGMKPMAGAAAGVGGAPAVKPMAGVAQGSVAPAAPAGPGAMGALKSMLGTKGVGASPTMAQPKGTMQQTDVGLGYGQGTLGAKGGFAQRAGGGLQGNAGALATTAQRVLGAPGLGGRAKPMSDVGAPGKKSMFGSRKMRGGKR